MTDWTYQNIGGSGVAEVDFLFSDGTDFLFSDGLDFVFREGSTSIVWTNPFKNTATYSYPTKN